MEATDEYLKRLKRVEREIIPRPIKFVLAKKRINAMNPSVSSYYLDRSSVNGGNNNSININNANSMNSDDDDLSFPGHKIPICEYKLVASKAHWKNISRAGGGLYNLGNTCFLNSVLQCLTYTAPLAQLASIKYHTNKSKHGNDMYCLMEQHINKALSAKSNRAFSPKPIVQKLQKISRNFRMGRQEDAHEFLRTFIDAMQKASLKAIGMRPNDNSRKAETTSIHRIFGGYLQSQVKCKICKFASTTYDACLDISLEIYGKSHTLEKALKQHTKLEVLDHDNRWRCDNCKKLVPATKQFKFRRLPLVLVIHLKRFSPYGDKISKRVEYPKELNMKSFTNNKDGEENFMYDLYGVLVHAGNYASSGHYYSFIKASNGAWYEMNDSSVQQIGIKRALNQQAYILFYQKRVVRVEKKIQTKTLSLKQRNNKMVFKNKNDVASPSSNCVDNNSFDVGEKVANLEDVWNNTKHQNNNSNNNMIGPSFPQPPRAPPALSIFNNREKINKKNIVNKEEIKTVKNQLKRRTYNASIHSIMKGQVGTPVLRRFIMNARALHGSKAYVGGNSIHKSEMYIVERRSEDDDDKPITTGTVPVVDYHDNKKMSKIISNNQNIRTVKFQQGNETIQFHDYNNGKININNSINDWKEMLKLRKSIRHYNLNKNGVNSEGWDFNIVDNNNNNNNNNNNENSDKMPLPNNDNHINPLKRLQKSLQNFQVRAEKDWAKKRRPDEWDSNYDQGKTKKVKNKNNYDGSVGIGKKLQKAYEAKHMILSTI